MVVRDTLHDQVSLEPHRDVPPTDLRAIKSKRLTSCPHLLEPDKCVDVRVLGQRMSGHRLPDLAHGTSNVKFVDVTAVPRE